MLKRFLPLFISVFIAALGCFAQKKDISSAKDMVKNNRDLPKAEMMMRTLLNDSNNRENTKIWDVLFDAVKKQYDNGNEQLYLKNKYDTTQLFVNARKMFEVYAAFDSIDARPNSHGQSRPKYRKKHAAFLLNYRKNLYTGGLFFVKKQAYADAYTMFDTYLECLSCPLFSESGLSVEKDANAHNAAYMSLFCGYKLNSYDKTMRYLDLALQDTANLNNKYQYLAETYRSVKDTALYVKTLEQGFGKFPTSMYYFPRLFDHYFNLHGNLSHAMNLCDQALKADSTNTVFLLAKSSLLLESQAYDACIDMCDKLIARNDSLADAYLNAGLTFYNQAIKYDANILEARKNRSKQRQLYKRAMPYLQQFRKLRPEEQAKWGLPLYTIYFNLNMGKEFDEIEKIIKKKNGQ